MFRRFLTHAARVVKPTMFISSPKSISLMTKPLMATPLTSRMMNLIPTTFEMPTREFHVKKKTNRRKVTKSYKLKTHRYENLLSKTDQFETEILKNEIYPFSLKFRAILSLSSSTELLLSAFG